MSHVTTRRVEKHRRRDDVHKGEWTFCPWCGQKLWELGVCRFCGGPASPAYATACDPCWFSRIAQQILGERTIAEIARLYNSGLSWNAIGKQLDISRPRMRGKDTRNAAMLLYEAEGSPGAAPYRVVTSEQERHVWLEQRDAAFDAWLRMHA